MQIEGQQSKGGLLKLFLLANLSRSSRSMSKESEEAKAEASFGAIFPTVDFNLISLLLFTFSRLLSKAIESKIVFPKPPNVVVVDWKCIKNKFTASCSNKLLLLWKLLTKTERERVVAAPKIEIVPQISISRRLSKAYVQCM